jgi:hypothetical protein
LDLRSQQRKNLHSAALRRLARPQPKPAERDGLGITLGGNPLRAQSVSNEALGLGDAIVLSGDSGVSQQERRKVRREISLAPPQAGNPGVKQLILINRNGAFELWVRSPTAAILLTDIVDISACSLTSTGPKITDFVVLFSGISRLGLTNKLDRFDGQQRTILYRAGNFGDTNPYIPRTLCLAKRGFWVSIPQKRFVDLPINPNLEYQAIPIIILVDLFHFPPIRIGLFEYTKIYGVVTIEKTTLDYYFSSYWQAGSNPVQEISSCHTAGVSTRTIPSSGGQTFVSTIEEILNLASDDSGTLVRRILAEGSGEYSGYRPVGLGTKESRVRLLYNYDTSQYEYLQDDRTLRSFIPGIDGIPDSIDLSNAFFDDRFLHVGHLNPIDKNQVLESIYPLARSYEDAYKTDKIINFFEIPNTTDLSFASWDPNSGATRPSADYLAIAYDRGEKIGRQYPSPDQPPSEGGGGGGGEN